MVQIMRKRRGRAQEEYEDIPQEMIKMVMHNNVGRDLFLVEIMSQVGKNYELREWDSLEEKNCD